ncbi:Zn(II)2Cys6 transcription factor domain-containing protein [Aspergillus undulatus]|uniref:Zn(II)2Cys6 transcription factor domain-containing protein n=1 Tax=Aspergillus undulatus TaxID=1810928 RepID=UPI003CCD6079
MADKQNPIACEPCRQKKCKCDRTLPVCSQCSDPARCIYPESGKRGLPQGYITHLENRLATTERALYSSYAYLRTISPRSFSIVESSQPNSSRTAAVNEWSRLPLHSPEDLEIWYSEKAQLFGGAESDVQAEWSPETVMGTAPRERDVPASTTSLNNLSRKHIQVRAAGYPREGRAERLAELEPGVYF